MRTTRIKGTKFITTVIATGLMAGTAFAAAGSVISVTLPETVSVGHTTLARGRYKMSEISLASAQRIFVFRDDKGDAAAVVIASKTADPNDVNTWGASQRTEVVLSPDQDGMLRLDKMFIEGDTTGYQFETLK
jgi:hypothetical protein